MTVEDKRVYEGVDISVADLKSSEAIISITSSHKKSIYH